jgi:hypothetical protein
MLLHRLVDTALAPLLEPMQLVHSTEDYVTVSRAEIDQLAVAYDDPQSVLAGFGPRAAASGVLVAEPTLSSAVLSRIWRSNRNEGAALTQVEGEILRQFLARLVGAWASAWQNEGIQLIPEMTMAGSLSMVQPQLADGEWHVARTVVREQGSSDVLGVLLFCYPAQLMPQLENEARSILWRSRVERGLNEREETMLAERLNGPLRALRITAPVTVRQQMTLGMLDSLERGDIVAFDTTPQGTINFQILGRAMPGMLARSGEQLAVAFAGDPNDVIVNGSGTATPESPPVSMPDFQPYDDPTAGPPEPIGDWDAA